MFSEETCLRLFKFGEHLICTTLRNETNDTSSVNLSPKAQVFLLKDILRAS